MAGITCAFHRLQLHLVSFSVTGRAQGATIVDWLDELAIDVFEDRL
jgi:hypothetical protein